MRRLLNLIPVLSIAAVVTAGAVSLFAQAPAPGQPPQQRPGGPGGAPGGPPGGFGDPWPNSRKLLAVADVQSGFHHDSISHALATVEQIGRKANAFVTMIRTDSQLVTKGQIVGKDRYEGRGVNARTLDYYDAIFMLPSGFGTMSEQQKKELLAYVHDEGKGLIVGHATGVAFTNWPEFGEMVGGYMDSEFNANAKIIVEDPSFPGAMAFGGATFMFNDQHPVFKEPYSRDKVHVIMRLDPASLDEKNRARRADGDFPVVWAKQYGKGRVFNVGWGHPDTTWDNPQFQAMMLEGIKWAMGVTKADVTPRPFPGATTAKPQAAKDGGLPDGPGKEAVRKICGECHTVEQAVSMRGSEKDWKDVIDLMVDRGATGSEEDFRTILAYLAKNYGPK
ncbi:MAG TPA: ThuA domain-containing protein [Vicinamibacterales bacterium]